MKTNRPLSTYFLHLLSKLAVFSLALAAVLTAEAVSDAALQRFYENDVKTAAGRARWHGKLVSTTIDTNTFSSITRYEDGTTFTDRASTLVDRVQAANRRLSTNNVPARLAAARARRASDASKTNTVTRTITAGH